MADHTQGILDQDSGVRDQWVKFVDWLQTFTEGLCAEFRACRRDIAPVLEDLAEKGMAVRKPASASLSGFRTARADAAAVLLEKPAAQWAQIQPARRVLRAISQYEQSLASLVGGMPAVISASGRQLAAILGSTASARLRLRLVAARGTPRPLAFRTIIETEIGHPAHPRIALEERYLMEMTAAARLLQRPWENVRLALDESAAGEAPGESAPAEAQPKRLPAAPLEPCGILLDKIVSLPGPMIRRISNRFLTAYLLRRGKTSAEPDGRSSPVHARWAAQVRASEEELRLGLVLAGFEDRFLGLLEERIRDAETEYEGIIADLTRTIDWLKLDHRDEGSFPEPEGKVVRSNMRLSELERAMQSELEALPPAAEVISRLPFLPALPGKLKKIQVRATYRRTFELSVRPLVLGVFRSIEAEHEKIIQGLERAREVVAFGAEPSASEDPDRVLAREAVQNALSLLEYFRNEPVRWQETADRDFVRAAGMLFSESRLILKRRHLGLFLYLAEQGLRRAFVEGTRRFASGTLKILRVLAGSASRVFLAFLVYIGWKASPAQDKVEVVTRPALPEEFVIDLTRKSMPLLYRHLFRFEPIQDPRFLVGREREMNAIAEARTFWEGNRPAAVIIVGRRGSGKTSLINCALKSSLSGLEVIRGEFGNRLISECRLRESLSRLVGAESAGLEEFMLRSRRVVIMEELERTFLRQIGYYEAVRALLRLIAATCPSTLWILATNQDSFQFLSASVQLEQSFSHRINAGGAGREDLRDAIMVRHNLSGLRLKFLDAPEPPRPLRKMLDGFQGRKGPEESFFDVLAEESNGVYRSAFDIWLRQIESFQAGELIMKPLVRPDLSPVVDALSLDDLFTLVAILQHGALTAEEHDIVFRKGAQSSRARIDGLLARQLIEQEPTRAGFRVRAQAMQVVREALYRRNLL